jgi:hypothetical protein
MLQEAQAQQAWLGVQAVGVAQACDLLVASDHANQLSQAA